MRALFKKLIKYISDINEGRLLIFLDNDFVSKRGAKAIAKKAKEDEVKKSISELFE